MAGHVILRLGEGNNMTNVPPDINAPIKDNPDEIIIWEPAAAGVAGCVRANRDFNNAALSLEKVIAEKVQLDTPEGRKSELIGWSSATLPGSNDPDINKQKAFIRRAMNASRVPVCNPYVKRMDYSTLSSFLMNVIMTYGAWKALKGIKEMENQAHQAWTQYEAQHAAAVSQAQAYNAAVDRQYINALENSKLIYAQQKQAVFDEYSSQYAAQLSGVGGSFAFWNTNLLSIGPTPAMSEMTALFNKLTLQMDAVWSQMFTGFPPGSITFTYSPVMMGAISSINTAWKDLSLSNAAWTLPTYQPPQKGSYVNIPKKAAKPDMPNFKTAKMALGGFVAYKLCLFGVGALTSIFDQATKINRGSNAARMQTSDSKFSHTNRFLTNRAGQGGTLAAVKRHIQKHDVFGAMSDLWQGIENTVNKLAGWWTDSTVETAGHSNTWRVYDIEITDPGKGYAAPPTVIIPAPSGWDGKDTQTLIRAKTMAPTLTADKGVEAVTVTDGGAGYTETGLEKLKVEFSGTLEQGGRKAKGRILVTNDRVEARKIFYRKQYAYIFETAKAFRDVFKNFVHLGREKWGPAPPPTGGKVNGWSSENWLGYRGWFGVGDVVWHRVPNPNMVDPIRVYRCVKRHQAHIDPVTGKEMPKDRNGQQTYVTPFIGSFPNSGGYSNVTVWKYIGVGNPNDPSESLNPSPEHANPQYLHESPRAIYMNEMEFYLNRFNHIIKNMGQILLQKFHVSKQNSNKIKMGEQKSGKKINNTKLYISKWADLQHGGDKRRKSLTAYVEPMLDIFGNIAYIRIIEPGWGYEPNKDHASMQDIVPGLSSGATEGKIRGGGVDRTTYTTGQVVGSGDPFDEWTVTFKTDKDGRIIDVYGGYINPGTGHGPSSPWDQKDPDTGKRLYENKTEFVGTFYRTRPYIEMADPNGGSTTFTSPAALGGGSGDVCSHNAFSAGRRANAFERQGSVISNAEIALAIRDLKDHATTNNEDWENIFKGVNAMVFGLVGQVFPSPKVDRKKYGRSVFGDTYMYFLTYRGQLAATQLRIKGGLERHYNYPADQSNGVGPVERRIWDEIELRQGSGQNAWWGSRKLAHVNRWKVVDAIQSMRPTVAGASGRGRGRVAPPLNERITADEKQSIQDITSWQGIFGWCDNNTFHQMSEDLSRRAFSSEAANAIYQAPKTIQEGVCNKRACGAVHAYTTVPPIGLAETDRDGKQITANKRFGDPLDVCGNIELTWQFFPTANSYLAGMFGGTTKPWSTIKFWKWFSSEIKTKPTTSPSIWRDNEYSTSFIEHVWTNHEDWWQTDSRFQSSWGTAQLPEIWGNWTNSFGFGDSWMKKFGRGVGKLPFGEDLVSIVKGAGKLVSPLLAIFGINSKDWDERPDFVIAGSSKKVYKTPRSKFVTNVVGAGGVPPKAGKITELKVAYWHQKLKILGWAPYHHEYVTGRQTKRTNASGALWKSSTWKAMSNMPSASSGTGGEPLDHEVIAMYHNRHICKIVQGYLNDLLSLEEGENNIHPSRKHLTESYDPSRGSANHGIHHSMGGAVTTLPLSDQVKPNEISKSYPLTRKRLLSGVCFPVVSQSGIKWEPFLTAVSGAMPPDFQPWGQKKNLINNAGDHQQPKEISDAFNRFRNAALSIDPTATPVSPFFTPRQTQEFSTYFEDFSKGRGINKFGGTVYKYNITNSENTVGGANQQVGHPTQVEAFEHHGLASPQPQELDKKTQTTDELKPWEEIDQQKQYNNNKKVEGAPVVLRKEHETFRGKGEWAHLFEDLDNDLGRWGAVFPRLYIDDISYEYSTMYTGLNISDPGSDTAWQPNQNADPIEDLADFADEYVRITQPAPHPNHLKQIWQVPTVSNTDGDSIQKYRHPFEMAYENAMAGGSYGPGMGPETYGTWSLPTRWKIIGSGCNPQEAFYMTSGRHERYKTLINQFHFTGTGTYTAENGYRDVLDGNAITGVGYGFTLDEATSKASGAALMMAKHWATGDYPPFNFWSTDGPAQGHPNGRYIGTNQHGGGGAWGTLSNGELDVFQHPSDPSYDMPYYPTFESFTGAPMCFDGGGIELYQTGLVPLSEAGLPEPLRGKGAFIGSTSNAKTLQIQPLGGGTHTYCPNMDGDNDWPNKPWDQGSCDNYEVPDIHKAYLKYLQHGENKPLQGCLLPSTGGWFDHTTHDTYMPWLGLSCSRAVYANGMNPYNEANSKINAMRQLRLDLANASGNLNSISYHGGNESFCHCVWSGDGGAGVNGTLPNFPGEPANTFDYRLMTTGVGTNPFWVSGTNWLHHVADVKRRTSKDLLKGVVRTGSNLGENPNGDAFIGSHWTLSFAKDDFDRHDVMCATASTEAFGGGGEAASILAGQFAEGDLRTMWNTFSGSAGYQNTYGASSHWLGDKAWTNINSCAETEFNQPGFNGSCKSGTMSCETYEPMCSFGLDAVITNPSCLHHADSWSGVNNAPCPIVPLYYQITGFDYNNCAQLNQGLSLGPAFGFEGTAGCGGGSSTYFRYDANVELNDSYWYKVTICDPAGGGSVYDDCVKPQMVEEGAFWNTVPCTNGADLNDSTSVTAYTDCNCTTPVGGGSSSYLPYYTAEQQLKDWIDAARLELYAELTEALNQQNFMSCWAPSQPNLPPFANDQATLTQAVNSGLYENTVNKSGYLISEYGTKSSKGSAYVYPEKVTNLDDPTNACGCHQPNHCPPHDGTSTMPCAGREYSFSKTEQPWYADVFADSSWTHSNVSSYPLGTFKWYEQVYSGQNTQNAPEGGPSYYFEAMSVWATFTPFGGPSGFVQCCAPIDCHNDIAALTGACPVLTKDVFEVSISGNARAPYSEWQYETELLRNHYSGYMWASGEVPFVTGVANWSNSGIVTADYRYTDEDGVYRVNRAPQVLEQQYIYSMGDDKLVDAAVDRVGATSRPPSLGIEQSLQRLGGDALVTGNLGRISRIGATEIEKEDHRVAFKVRRGKKIKSYERDDNGNLKLTIDTGPEKGLPAATDAQGIGDEIFMGGWPLINPAWPTDFPIVKGMSATSSTRKISDLVGKRAVILVDKEAAKTAAGLNNGHRAFIEKDGKLIGVGMNDWTVKTPAAGGFNKTYEGSTTDLVAVFWNSEKFNKFIQDANTMINIVNSHFGVIETAGKRPPLPPRKHCKVRLTESASVGVDCVYYEWEGSVGVCEHCVTDSLDPEHANDQARGIFKYETKVSSDAGNTSPTAPLVGGGGSAAVAAGPAGGLTAHYGDPSPAPKKPDERNPGIMFGEQMMVGLRTKWDIRSGDWHFKVPFTEATTICANPTNPAETMTLKHWSEYAYPEDGYDKMDPRLARTGYYIAPNTPNHGWPPALACESYSKFNRVADFSVPGTHRWLEHPKGGMINLINFGEQFPAYAGAPDFETPFGEGGIYDYDHPQYLITRGQKYHQLYTNSFGAYPAIGGHWQNDGYPEKMYNKYSFYASNIVKSVFTREVEGITCGLKVHTRKSQETVHPEKTDADGNEPGGDV